MESRDFFSYYLKEYADSKTTEDLQQLDKSLENDTLKVRNLSFSVVLTGFSQM